MGMDSVWEEPGLQSVARATGTPASMSRRAGAYWCFIRKKLVPGRRTAVTPERARASIAGSARPRSGGRRRARRARRPARRRPSRRTRRRGAAEPSHGDAPASSTRRDSSAVNTPSSQNTSQNRASPCLGRGRDDLLADQIQVALRGPPGARAGSRGRRAGSGTRSTGWLAEARADGAELLQLVVPGEAVAALGLGRGGPPGEHLVHPPAGRWRPAPPRRPAGWRATVERMPPPAAAISW